jgi:hypothetical protein
VTCRYKRNRESYAQGRYGETQLRREYIDPFFKALGWDVDNTRGWAEAYKDVIHEDAIRIGGTRKFFIEAKALAVNLKLPPTPCTNCTALKGWKMGDIGACSAYPTHPVKSDDLMQLRRFFEEHATMLHAIRPLFKIQIIIDTNVVIRDLIRLAKRGDAQERSWIQELCAAGTLTACAPSILDAEVRRNLPLVAKERHVSLPLMVAQWEVYLRSIAFIDAPDKTVLLDTDVRHPNDLPYIWLQQRTDALIYTNDKDIPAMGGRTIGYTVIAHLCDYSRNAAVEYTIKYQGIILASIGVGLAKQVFSFLRSLSVHARRMPSWIWLIGGAAVLIALLHPRVRMAVVSHLCSLPPKARQLGSVLAEMTEPFMIAHSEAKRNADTALENAIVEIGKSAGSSGSGLDR